MYKALRSFFLFQILIGFVLTLNAADKRKWLAGDHHIHSEYSVGWEDANPPRPIVGGDAIYSITFNAGMGRQFGLDWMVATDHGGPNHSKINLEMAYPEILAAREAVPDVLLFVGLELNTPGADHSSIIVPHTYDEAEQLFQYESLFDKRESWPIDESRDAESLMLEAIEYVDQWKEKPVIIAHHPSRSAKELGEYGETTPAELRKWNDASPEVAVGMEGAPGHQAAKFTTNENKGFYPAWVFARGAYGRGYPTMGGFDQMTAKLGGFWDSMLSEGRRWWITANSDSHIHYTEGGIDFWPGEYSKTYVFAKKHYDDIIDGIRNGRVFVTTGDLVNELYVTVSGADHQADIGGRLTVNKNEKVTIEIRFKDPITPNAGGNNPSVKRVDLIVGEVSGRHDDLSTDTSPATKVVKRFTSWSSEDDFQVISYSLNITRPVYLRVRGSSNKEELEPAADGPEEDPWGDLWFYSNPVFVDLDAG